MCDAGPRIQPIPRRYAPAGASLLRAHDRLGHRRRRCRPGRLRQGDRSGQADGTIDNPQGWLFRIAHNAALDRLRYRARHPEVPLESDTDITETMHLSAPDDDIVAVGFGTFLRLPVLQRCAVVLKDLLGHSVEEIAAIAGCSVPA